MYVQVMNDSRFNPPGLLVPEPVFPWGPDGPAFIACPGAVPHGMVAASRSHFLHVAEARRGGRRRQRAAKKAAREAAAPAESDPE